MIILALQQLILSHAIEEKSSLERLFSQIFQSAGFILYEPNELNIITIPCLNLNLMSEFLN